MLDRRNTNPIMCSVFFPPSLHQTPPQGHGILTVCPSTPTFVIALGPTNPWLITSAKETLGLRRTRISRVLWLLVPTFSLPNAPQALPGPASLQIGTLSYHTLVSLRSHARRCAHGNIMALPGSLTFVKGTPRHGQRKFLGMWGILLPTGPYSGYLIRLQTESGSSPRSMGCCTRYERHILSYMWSAGRESNPRLPVVSVALWITNAPRENGRLYRTVMNYLDRRSLTELPADTCGRVTRRRVVRPAAFLLPAIFRCWYLARDRRRATHKSAGQDLNL